MQQLSLKTGLTSRTSGACHNRRLAVGSPCLLIPAICTKLTRRRHIVRNQLGDELLDFIQAGRKMRRWYGEDEMLGVGRSGGDSPQPEEDEEFESDGDAVLVTDAEGAVGEQVVLQLILARANVRVLVNDVAKAKAAYGPYVTPVSVDINSPAAMQRALKGVGSVVMVGKLGALPQVLDAAGVCHAVLLSTTGTGSQGGIFGSLFQSADTAVLADPSREASISKCSIPYSIVRSAPIQQTPGGMASIALSQGSAAPKGSPISCEDLAAVLVATLRRPPASGRVFQVSNTGPGQPPEEWSTLFNQLSEAVAA